MSVEVLVFIVLVSLSLAITWLFTHHSEREHRATLERSVAQGLDEPPSLHPEVDPVRCVGTRSCVAVCPEGDVLGIVKGCATLIAPSRCIGHGACAAACPVDAIQLVFGTARRGVEIPYVKPNFETNVPGVFVVGELGGMGLVRNAMNQGIQAVEEIATSASARAATEDALFDVAIVGAGPAGIAASLAAQQAGLRHVTFEQEALGGTVYHYPRKKMVVTRPFDIPGYGTLRAQEIRKEELLTLWRNVIDRTEVTIRLIERVEEIHRRGDCFEITTDKGSYLAAHVILAIGRRGSPRKLGIPGEEAPHVSYSLGDAADVSNTPTLVIGGGNSAVEAAIALAAPSLGNQVTLSYRGRGFARCTEKNRQKLAELEHQRQLTVLRESVAEAIEPEKTQLRVGDAVVQVSAKRVFVMIGGVLPTALLHQLGIGVEVKYGTA